MYYFLTLVGIIMILFGYKDSKPKVIEPIVKQKHRDEMEELLKRIENIETTLYDTNINFDKEDTEKEITINIDYSSKNNEEGLTIFDKLKKCEEEGYSLEMICSILEMNKGEVLLLKNLYKNYQV